MTLHRPRRIHSRAADIVHCSGGFHDPNAARFSGRSRGVRGNCHLPEGTRQPRTRQPVAPGADAYQRRILGTAPVVRRVRTTNANLKPLRAPQFASEDSRVSQLHVVRNFRLREASEDRRSLTGAGQDPGAESWQIARQTVFREGEIVNRSGQNVFRRREGRSADPRSSRADAKACSANSHRLPQTSSGLPHGPYRLPPSPRLRRTAVAPQRETGITRRVPAARRGR